MVRQRTMLKVLKSKFTHRMVTRKQTESDRKGPGTRYIFLG
jgi:hypothetical protein